MTDHLATTAAAVAIIGSTTLGAKVGSSLATVAGEGAPAWMGIFLGPLGALAGMIFAVWWLAGRLNKAEEKADKREAERDADRKSLITVVEQNSQVIREVKEVIHKCRGQ
jgi:hypothetical protein